MSLEYNLNFIKDKSKKSTIKKAISILERAFYSRSELSSFFLDPYEREVIESIAKKNNIDLTFIGGHSEAERKIFVANYYYLPLNLHDYIEILSFNCKDIKHPDVLGALISLGLDRESIGDISVLDGKVEFALLASEANFVKYNLSKIKNESIDIHIKEDGRLLLKESEFSSSSGFVSSLRLDNIISQILNCSRSRAKVLITGRMVKVDHQIIVDPSYQVSEASLISVRKEGRFIFDEVTGLSKKGNYHIVYRKLLWYIF